MPVLVYNCSLLSRVMEAIEACLSSLILMTRNAFTCTTRGVCLE
jgi:hypothetical protein